MAEWQTAIIGTVIGVTFAVVLFLIIKRLYLVYLLTELNRYFEATREAIVGLREIARE